MQLLTVSLVLLLLLSIALARRQVYYVRPNDSYSCPGQPCLTLDKYTERTRKYFTKGSTFEFLAGNHSILNTVILSRISDVTFRGNLDLNVTLIFKNKAAILCDHVTKLVIEKLVFLFDYGEANEQTTALNITYSNHIVINSSAFQRI